MVLVGSVFSIQQPFFNNPLHGRRRHIKRYFFIITPFQHHRCRIEPRLHNLTAIAAMKHIIFTLTEMVALMTGL
jgi:hypothetical protein